MKTLTQVWFHRETPTPKTSHATAEVRKMVRVGDRGFSNVKAIVLDDVDGVPVVRITGHDSDEYEYPLSSIACWDRAKPGRPPKGGSK